MIYIISNKYVFVYTYSNFRIKNHLLLLNSLLENNEIVRAKSAFDNTKFLFDNDCSEILENLEEGLKATILLSENFLWVCLDNGMVNIDTYIDLEELFSNKFKKYLVTNKQFVSSLFIEEYSDNLLEITIDKEDYYEALPEDLYYGSGLNYSSEYEEIIRENEIEISSFKIQPQSSNSTITFFNENLIQFSELKDESEMAKQIQDLSIFFNKTL